MNILVIRNDRFGEFLLNVPAIQALKGLYPQAKLSLAVSSKICELADSIQCVDEIVAWDEIKKDLKKYKFDLCVILNPTKEAHWAVFWAGIKMRLGYDRKWGFLLTHKLKDTKYLGDRHEVDCNLELVGMIGAKTIDKTFKIRVNNVLYKELIGQKIVAIHAFTSDSVKQWPLERFKELAQRVNRELGVKVVMIGLAKDVLVMDANIVNMVNKTSLVELAALLKRCVLLISGDSGPMHLAAAVGTPVIALFRNDLPGKTAQRWGPWGQGHIVIEKNRLEDINVDEVFGKVKERVKL